MKTNKLIEYSSPQYLETIIDAFWSFRNIDEDTIDFPVVPDACNDIIFVNRQAENGMSPTKAYVVGTMDKAKIVSIKHANQIFGIRFKPGVLYCLLKYNMKLLINKRILLQEINKPLYQKFKIDLQNDDKLILDIVETILLEEINRIEIDDKYSRIINKLKDDPQIPIATCADYFKVSIKSIERMFNYRVGLSPKSFCRVLRFQKAHEKILRRGLKQLIAVALDSGYFDQAHFNHEYKRLVGCNPSNETMSILYNTYRPI